jgi:hypothetical protein
MSEQQEPSRMPTEAASASEPITFAEFFGERAALTDDQSHWPMGRPPRECKVENSRPAASLRVGLM